MLNRRSFLKKTSIGAGLLAAGSFPLESFAGSHEKKLTILHTNDVHSRLDPFPNDGGKLAGMGGVAARAALISQIRGECDNVLLLDAGDMLQGTPYFNMYKGEPEIKAMTMMGYDACTMGNHDFDAGIDGFARLLPFAGFPVLVANYDFTNTPLEHKTAPYTVIKKGGLKIGIFGLGIELEGLVSGASFGNTKYNNPIPVAKAVSEKLKRDEKCDMVICLSHLGYEYETNKISDKTIAKETKYIDLIIGGHTHTFLDSPATERNAGGGETLINQVGWGGVQLGRLDYVFHSGKNPELYKSHSVNINKETSG